MVERRHADPDDQTAIMHLHEPAARGRHESPDQWHGGVRDRLTSSGPVSPPAGARTAETSLLGIVPPTPPPEPGGDPAPGRNRTGWCHYGRYVPRSAATAAPTPG